jgi:hypothetical protein
MRYCNGEAARRLRHTDMQRRTEIRCSKVNIQRDGASPSGGSKNPHGPIRDVTFLAQREPAIAVRSSRDAIVRY